MKHLWIYSLVSLFFAFASFYLALKGVDDWGWFLIASVCTFVYPSGRKKENKDEDSEI